MDKEYKFMKFETIFIRIHLFMIGFGLFLLSLLFAAQNSIESIARVFLGVVNTMLFLTITLFIISIIRVIKYFVKFRKSEGLVNIKRSVCIMLTSPLSFAIYLILTLAMSLSLASCS